MRGSAEPIELPQVDAFHFQGDGQMGCAPQGEAARGASGREPFIRVDEIAKTYSVRSGGSVDAVDGVSFEIGEGAFTSIVGPSGCGKSTLLKIIGGLLAPSKGRVHHLGLEPGQKRPSLGMVFQEAVLLPWRTVLQNVVLPLEIAGSPRESAETRAREMISLVGLAGFEKSYPSELSGGMQQRASIARSLVHDPRLLLMDEPFGALDAMTRESMANELQRIWAQSRKTVIFITHSIAEAVFLSDQIIVMSGRPSRIVEIVDVRLPRPRSVEMTTTKAFADYVMRIRQHLSISGEL